VGLQEVISKIHLKSSVIPAMSRNLSSLFLEKDRGVSARDDNKIFEITSKQI